MSASFTPATRGFTLIEVVVALAMTSMVLLIIMNGALGAKDRLRRAEDRDSAVLMASSLIAEQAATGTGAIEQTGKNERLSWTIVESELARDPRGFFVLDRIEVKLFDRKGQQLYAASTRKLRPIGGL